jgi:molybdopterin synthase sulfur carrier subunit
VATVPTGLINYWAAAREAAGTAQEPFEAKNLADALSRAVQAHGPELARVLARCAFVIDGSPVGSRPHASVALADGATVDVLPPFAGGSEAAQPPAGSIEVAQIFDFRRGPVPGFVIATGGCGLLLLASWAGRPVLGAALLLLQLILVAGWFSNATLRTPGQAAGAVAAMLAAIAADVVLLNEVDDASVRPLTVVLAALVVVAFVVQLARRDGRDRLTDALAATIGAGALCVTMASLLGVRGGADGGGVVLIALAAVGSSLVVLALLLWLPVLPAVSRTALLTATLLIALGVGVGAGAGVAGGVSGVSGGAGAVIAAVATVLALTAAWLVVLAGDAVPLRPIVATLPIAVVGPAVLIVARIMVG